MDGKFSLKQDYSFCRASKEKLFDFQIFSVETKENRSPQLLLLDKNIYVTMSINYRKYGVFLKLGANMNMTT